MEGLIKVGTSQPLLAYGSGPKKSLESSLEVEESAGFREKN